MPEMEKALDAPSTGDRRRKLLNASAAYMRGEINVQQLEDVEQKYSLNLPAVLRALSDRRANRKVGKQTIVHEE